MDFIHFLNFMMLTVFVSYISFIWIKYGIQRSISDSYYRLPRNLQPLFTFFCWGFAIPAIIIGTTLTDSVLMFLAGSGIAFVGAAAAFKQKMTKTVHMIGAYGGVALSQLSIWINFKMWYITIGFLVLAIILQLFSKKIEQIWWQETLAFLSICLVFFIAIYS